MTLISPTGYGGTGSSAVTNILEEFDNIKNTGNEEFQFTSYPDGISDLEYFFMEGSPQKTDLAIKRFLDFANNLSTFKQYKKVFNNKFESYAKNYIKDIISMEWNGWWPHFDNDNKILSNKEKIKLNYIQKQYSAQFKKYIKTKTYEPDGHDFANVPFNRSMVYYTHLYNENEQNNFLNKTKIFTDQLLNEAVSNEEKNYKYIILDQAIPSLNISHHMRYFSSLPKVIVVDRDPRDLYILNKVFWGEGWIPSYDINLFIRYYKQVRQTRKNESEASNNSVLFLNFESLVYEYDKSINDIIKYINLTEKEHIDKLKYFNPEYSNKNTQVFIDYPDLSSDINLIERELSDYCYNFSYKKPSNAKNVLFVENILNNFNNTIIKTQKKLIFKINFIFYYNFILCKNILKRILPSGIIKLLKKK